MARRTEGVTERLIAAARDEFLEKGFENASLRTIAQRAQSSTGAIYVRYSDKEDLFGAVVDPITDGLCAFFTTELDEYLDLSDETQQEAREAFAARGMEAVVDYLFDHQAEFTILLAAGGPRYDRLLRRLVGLSSSATYRFIEMTGNDAVSSGRLPPELMGLITRSYLSGILNTVASGVTREEARAYVNRLSAFFRAGWQSVFNPDIETLIKAAEAMPSAPIAHLVERLETRSDTD